MKFFHRYEANGGRVLQDKECIIAIGRYILFYYPDTGEFLQIDEKVSTYPGAVNITLNEYVGRLGFFRGLWLSIKNLIGISHCPILPCETKEEGADTFEEFFEDSLPVQEDLRPPVIFGGGYIND